MQHNDPKCIRLPIGLAGPMSFVTTLFELPSAWLWLFAFLAVAASSVVSAATIWAVFSARHWFIRAAVIGGMLALALPIQAYDLFVIFLAQVGFGALFCILFRWWWALEECAIGRGERLSNLRQLQQGWADFCHWRPQFSVLDLLLLTGLIGCLIGVVASFPAKLWRGDVEGLVLLGLLLSGSSGSVLTWHARLNKRIVRWLSFLILAGAPAFPLYYYAAKTPGLPIIPTRDFALLWLLPPLVGAIGQTFWFQLLRKSGRWTGNIPPRMPTKAGTTTAAPAPSHGALCGCIILAGLALGPLAVVYAKIGRPPAIPGIALPNPNSYDELLEAGNALQGAPDPRDADHWTLAFLQAFWSQQGPAIERARDALTGPCQPIHRWDYDDSLGGHVLRLRNVGNAFFAAARLAEMEGRIDDALAWQLREARLGNIIQRGEFTSELYLAASFENSVTNELARLTPSRTVEQLKALIVQLQELEAQREPISQIVDRRNLCLARVFGWQMRWTMVLELWGLLGSDFFKEEVLPEMFRSVQARRRLLICQLALRMHDLENGGFPDSLDSLVPAYLPSVPVDPFGVGPLIYRPQADGYLLYSIGPDGRDDGGQPVDWHKRSDGGDLLLDEASPMIQTEANLAQK